MTQTQHEKGLEYYKELLSCLSDGELSALELEDLLQALPKFPELRTYWFRLQVKKSVVKKDFNVHTENLLWVNKVTEALAQEAVVAFPVSDIKKSNTKDSFSGLANFAIAASVMLVVTVGWLGSQAEFRQVALAYFEPQTAESTSVEASNINQIAINRSVQTNNKVRVSSGNVSSEPSSSVNDLYLSNERIQEYMLLHAEHASLNTNHGMLPFARMSKVSPTSGKQF